MKTIRVFGKWILAGEYAVLKSHPALAFPLYSHFVDLSFVRNLQRGKTTISAENLIDQTGLMRISSAKLSPAQAKKAFSSVLHLALQKVGKNPADLSCDIQLRSCMAFGQGLGGSAVLCVLVGRLFQRIKWLRAKKLFDFCHDLENHLHGQSSGLDIAVILHRKPVLFFPKGNKGALAPLFPKTPSLSKRHNNRPTPQIKIFQPVYQPFIFLSYSGPGKATKDNIKKIKLFWKNQPEKSKRLNQQMNKAVFKALESLSSKSNVREKDERLLALKEAFYLSENCFLKWGLIGSQMKQHIAFLKKQGALAVKPTGSGSGGYVLSLWAKEPPAYLKPLLIPAFSAKNMSAH